MDRILVSFVVSVLVACSGADPIPSPVQFSPPPDVGAAGLPPVNPCRPLQFYERPAVECIPGSRTPAICRGGPMGYRVCNSEGSGRSPTACPGGGVPIGQDVDWVIITRPAVELSLNFWRVLNLRSFGRTGQAHSSAVLTADELVAMFPAPTIPESIRAAERHLLANELPRLQYVMFVGDLPPDLPRENAAVFATDYDLPVSYVATPQGHASLDLADETVVPTWMYYEYLQGEWPSNFGGRFWTPEVGEPDVRVGALPFNGVVECSDADGTYLCGNDLGNFADKVEAWESGADHSFVRSRFDGAVCAGTNWGVQGTGAPYGDAFVTYDHACEGGEAGDVGVFATADGADFAFVVDHGNPYGVGGIGAYTLNGLTAFPGIVGAHACGTTAFDEAPSTMPEQLLSSADGPVAFIGYGRIAAVASLRDPVDRAFTAGRYTLGAMVDGMRRDALRDLPPRYMVKDAASLTLVGDPAMPLIPGGRADTGIKVTGTGRDENGQPLVCVEAWGDPNTAYAVAAGNIIVGEVTTYPHGWAMPTSLPVATAVRGSTLRLAACDPEIETCQLSELEPEPTVSLDGGRMWRSGQELFVSVTPRLGVIGEQLSWRITVIRLECREGPVSDCVLDAWDSARRETVVLDEPIAAAAEPQEHVLSFQLPASGGPGVYYRATRIELVSGATDSFPGDVVGIRYVNHTGGEAEVEELGLL
jgi:hypothetical protein